MKSYLNIVSKYLSAHKRKTHLTIISIAISVALVCSIFSMLDVFLQFEKIQEMHDSGNFHILVKYTSEREMSAIKNRVDVKNSGRWANLKNGNIKGITCRFAAIDENYAKNMNIKVISGKFPQNKSEIMLEGWATESLYLNARINDRIRIKFADNVEREFIVSGIFDDFSSTKASGVPGVIMSVDGAYAVDPKLQTSYLVEFKKGVNIINAISEIKKELNIEDKRIGKNDRLLAVIGQSRNGSVMQLYAVGAFLFVIVLAAGVVMIYNTFNISVMERVRQFGLLRCIGASQSQVKKIVRREGLCLTLWAIPSGTAAGIIITFICSAILKLYNGKLFGDISLFTVSPSGIAAGIVTGFATVFIASLMPAKKASMVSPVNAVTGSSDIKDTNRKKQGFLTKTLRAEIAMGINNATAKKKTLLLMSVSIAISIIMFFGFNVFINFMHSSLKTTKPYTPDISLISEKGIDNNMIKKLAGINGVKRVYGRMFGYVDATFDASRLTDTYKNNKKNIAVKDNGLIATSEKSWLISYDKNQLTWAKEDLLQGTLDMDKLNSGNGVVAVTMNSINNISTQNTDFKIGDRIYVSTSSGVKEMTIMGILRSAPFSDSKSNLTTFIATEELFTELTGDSTFRAIDIQVNNRKAEQTVNEIKAMAGSGMSFTDRRQNNSEIDQTFLTMAVFVYGFVLVIALISILNIINTMNTSVASKTKYLGVMRAVGMSGDQLDKMILVEAATYSITGCAAGCILGVLLQNFLIKRGLSSLHIVWRFPVQQIAIILLLTAIVTVISVLSPLKRIKAKGITEVVNSL